MDKPTSIRIPPDTRKALEAIRDASAVPVTLSAVAVEAMRRGVAGMQTVPAPARVDELLAEYDGAAIDTPPTVEALHGFGRY